MIVDQDMLKLVKSNSLFKNLPDTFLKSFIKPKKFFLAKEGTLLYSFDDTTDAIYLIVKGDIKIKFVDNRNIEYRYLLDFFGEKEVLEKTNRISFAIANKDCILYKIEAVELQYLMNNESQIKSNIMNFENAQLVEC
jgi:CRP-like cAMP-binding protein